MPRTVDDFGGGIGEASLSVLLELWDRYAHADTGFVDVAVLAMVERLNEAELATLDHRHFGAMRPRHVEALGLAPG